MIVTASSRHLNMASNQPTHTHGRLVITEQWLVLASDKGVLLRTDRNGRLKLKDLGEGRWMLLGPTPNNEANLKLLCYRARRMIGWNLYVNSVVDLFLSDVPLNSGVSSFSNDDILFEIRVGNELFGTTACVSFMTSVSMTRGGECVDAVIESNEDVTYVRFPTEAGVGEIEYSVRIHNGVIKIPTVGVAAFVEGTLVNMPLEEGVFRADSRSWSNE